jgi:hypothetical protein
MSRPKTRLAKRIEDVAIVFNKSTVTVRTWVAEGLDVFNLDEVIRWWQFKESRRRNRRAPSSNGVSAG